MGVAVSDYERLLAESEQLAQTLAADDWDEFMACLDRRQVLLDDMGRTGERSSGAGDASEEAVLIERILAVERTVSGLVASRMTGVSAEALDRRLAREAYADRSEPSMG